ncbi:HsdR family type I site-specific deoxyribonuclease [soil metagenome]
MNRISSYLEDKDSQLPALRLLQQMGYTYLSPEKALEMRDGLLTRFVLSNILENQLSKINRIEYKGKTLHFPQPAISRAAYDLQQQLDEGLVKTNEKIYDLLTLGKSYEQVVKGDKKSFPFRYVDWENPENNMFHVTDEFEIKGKTKVRRVDIVLFVNGIPFVAIENKRRDKKNALDEAISQHLRNQNKDEVPGFFHFTQMLLASNVNDFSYAATDTSKKFWSVWREEEDIEETVKDLIAKPDTNTSWIHRLRVHYFEKPQFEEKKRQPTKQDLNMYSLCRPDRLLELTRNFTVFDNNTRKIARYQQYFGVKRMMNRIRQTDEDDNRKGGVIWHTQGSGKSITMIFMSKNLAVTSDITSHRILIVTDRTDLDDQLTKTFKSCGKEIKQAKTGTHLAELIQDPGVENISTIINKFNAALNQKAFVDNSRNIFVLIDESHRTQYGMMHARMRKILPNACYIGFTGTPLMKHEKNTAAKFGGIIDSYSMDQAVKDKAVVPIIYEGRAAKLDTWREKLDREFERDMEGMSEDQVSDYKRRYSTINKLMTAQLVIEEVCKDVTGHFLKNLSSTKYKAQLAVPDRKTAVRYYRFLMERGQINAELLISPPDTREGHDDTYDDPNDEVQIFWKQMMDRFGSKEEYETSIVNLFKSDSREVELIIVVYKLLTGFDSPNNTVLYLARYLDEHNLLQAIARVNRLFEGKDCGFVIDYVGILGTLTDAMNTYSALSGFEEDDLEGAITPIHEVVNQLPELHQKLWDIFKDCDDTDDNEAMEQFLRPDDVRDEFYEVLSNFARTLQAVFTADKLFDYIDESEIIRYKKDLKFFENLRRSVRIRYGESIDHREYEDRVQKLIDSYVGTEGIDQIIEPVDIFSDEFQESQEEQKDRSEASKADEIASKTKKVIQERMDEDPALYRKFSDLIEEAIQKFLSDRISEKEYLKKVKQIKNGVRQGIWDGTPNKLKERPIARSYYNTVKSELEEFFTKTYMPVDEEIREEHYIKAGLELDEITDGLTIVDWVTNPDVKNRMFIAIEDYMIELFRNLDLKRDFDVIERIAETIIKSKQSFSTR